MKLSLNSSGAGVYNLMRSCGYFFKGKKGVELVFSRQIGNSGSGYPRFHAYVKVSRETSKTEINLHLDQKKPVYKSSAHGAEYEGELVEKEALRIKSIFSGR